MRSTTHGTFYQRPAPDAEPYVRIGSRVSRGTTLGLVEVMKCFSQVGFEPPNGIEAGEVVGIDAADGSEVQAEQVLLRIRID